MIKNWFRQKIKVIGSLRLSGVFVAVLGIFSFSSVVVFSGIVSENTISVDRGVSIYAFDMYSVIVKSDQSCASGC